jgi:aminoglycoside/choline kinase family phosphotransferase
MTSAVIWADPARHAAFDVWLAPLAESLALRPETLQAASADASFRRYLRIDSVSGATFIVMDAPPPQEDVRPFVNVAALIERAGLHAPKVLAADLERGFVLLSDLGRSLYLDALRDATPPQADRLMRDALHALVRWQTEIDASSLPPYDDALLRRELALFPDWCVTREFGVTWSDAQHAQWQKVCDMLVASALAQPQVAVHRDWMPRNLMVAEPLPVGDDFGAFWKQLEWMGLQRHLKVLGIFCRLKHRDGKPHYAADLPRFFAYATHVARRYRELTPLLPLIEPLSGMKANVAYSLR